MCTKKKDEKLLENVRFVKTIHVQNFRISDL